MAHTFAARYPGTCADGDTIEPGDEVTYISKGVIVHAKCSGAEHKPSRQEKMCGKCFMLHAGECF